MAKRKTIQSRKKLRPKQQLSRRRVVIEKYKKTSIEPVEVESIDLYNTIPDKKEEEIILKSEQPAKEIKKKDNTISYLNKKPIPFFLYSFLSLFIIFILSECIFKFIHFGFTVDLSILRIALFCLGTSSILAFFLSFLPIRLGRILNTLSCFIAVIYAFFQLGIYNMMHSFVTLKTGGGMAGAMTGYVLEYIKQVPYRYWLMFLIPFGYWLFSKKLNIQKTNSAKALIVLLVVALLSDGAGLLLQYVYGTWSQYSYPSYQETAIREYGIERFLIRDIVSIFKEKDTTIEVETSEDPTPQIASTSDNELSMERVIDDTLWEQLSNEEENEDLQTIDNYLMSRSIDGYNDKTGLLEGKNLIYIMIEAFDYIAIDEELTPTLYKMKEEGWDFSNHYTPKFSTGTSDSELISEVSLVPRMDINVYDTFSSNDWTNSIFYLFNNAGYSTHAFHNWKDEFYPRHTMMESLYCEDYRDYDDMEYDTISGWQSDYEMMKLTIDEYIDEDQFMTMYITSSTHFPYDTDWDVLGNKYLDEIDAVHPDYPSVVKHYISKAMELDKAMEYLLERLEKAGKLEDTAIVFFADHHPLNMDVSYIEEYTTEVDRTEGKNEFRSPMVIYCPSILGDETFTDVSSTYDILPTVLNLYNLDYDPRLYLGSDYFSETESIVYFPNGDWLTEKGIYYSSTGEFVSTTNEKVSDAYIQKNTSKTNNAFNISYLIYTSDYFHYRNEITTPDDSMPAYEIMLDPETGEEIKVEKTEESISNE